MNVWVFLIKWPVRVNAVASSKSRNQRGVTGKLINIEQDGFFSWYLSGCERSVLMTHVMR